MANEIRVPRQLDTVAAAFDDERLIANAGVLMPVTLMGRLGSENWSISASISAIAPAPLVPVARSGQSQRGPDELLAQVQRTNARLYRACLLKQELRALDGRGVDADGAAAHLDRWLAWASRSRLKPFVKLARTIRKHREGILDAVRIGISNGRVEGLNTKIRLLSSRSFGFRSSAPLIALVYHCCGGIEAESPWR